MTKSIPALARISAFSLLALSLHGVPQVAQAQDLMAALSNNGEGYDLSDSVLGEDSAFDFGGWTQFGYTTRSTGLFNDQKHSIRNQQTWLYAEKAVDGSDGLDIGFRVDAMFGADAQDTQSFGNNEGEWDLRDNFNHGDDGFAIPQLYVEAAAGDFSIKGGHFYTLVGYEVVTAPDNFFMSHAFTMYLSEPFTHTGAVATYSGFENIEFYGGWTAGWDTGFDQFDGGSSFLGGFSVNPMEKVALTYIATAGNLGAIGDGYSHSLVIDTAITDKLNYVLQSDLVTTNADVLGVGKDYESYGLNNYLTYWCSDMFGVGTRAEWWNANDASYYEVTAGVNYKPVPNLTFRPELRYQWGDASESESQMVTADNPAGLPVGEGAIFGMDAILTF